MNSQNQTSLTNFENIEEKFYTAINSEPYHHLVSLCQKYDNIYVIANGGLHYVASHMATDMSRLLAQKYVHSFDSFGFITSNANDFGFDSIFKRWLECCVSQSSTSLLIGLSCSGRSKNIITAMDYVSSKNWDCFLITGKKPTSEYPYLCINACHYHTVECFSLMLFYELIHSMGGLCPTIS